MTEAQIITLLVTGIFVGFASGLLGVGGGFIMTPIQYAIYTNMGVPPDMAIKLAFATNLLVIFPVALSGAWRHSKQGTVFWNVAVIMGSCSLVAAFGGAVMATSLPGAWLKIGFGAVVLLGSVRMLTARPLQIETEPRYNPWLWIAFAIPIGFVTGILGIGGGVLMVPLMMLVLKFRIQNAVATSLAVMIFTSIGGVGGYIIGGLGLPDLPPYSIGYVYLPAWIILVATSVGMAQVGAITTGKLPDRQLRYILVAVMFYVGLKMLGVFDWLGWVI